MPSMICPGCGNIVEPIYEMGQLTPSGLVGCTCPGPVLDTGISDEDFEKYRQKILRDLP